jgi:hypothetical protein
MAELHFQMPKLRFQMPELPFEMPKLRFQMPELPFQMLPEFTGLNKFLHDFRNSGLL